jgi:hypothetical protein
MAVVLPSGGSFLGRILFFLSIFTFWLDEIIMTSPASLNGAVLTSLELPAIGMGVAFIRLGGVKFVFLMVSLNFTIFLVLPNSTFYSKLESLSL